MRLTKTVDGVTHTYSLDGDRIVAEEWGNQLLVYFYDDDGLPMGMMYRNSSYADKQFDYYLYEKDVFGNILAIYNANGTKVASYCYDAWGNCTVLTNTNGIGAMNPFRYRGYYLDTETNLYYLQTRYYDSYTGRFINADDAGNLGIGDELLSYNLFSYCANNPVMGYDPTGEWTFSMGGTISLNFGGFGITLSLGLSFDSDGDWAPQFSYSFPNYGETTNTPIGQSMSAGIYTQWTNLDSVSELEKESYCIGANTPVLGADIVFNKEKQPIGTTVTLGPGIGIDVHQYKAYTYSLGGSHRTLLKFLNEGFGWYRHEN